MIHKNMKYVFMTGLLMSAAAFADDGKIYLDVGVGYSQRQNMPTSAEYELLPGVGASGTSTQTDENEGGRAVIGMLWGTEAAVAYGAEVGAAYYGTNKYSTNSSSATLHYYGIEFLGVTQFNIDKWHVILKAGGTDEQLQVTQDNAEDTGLSDNNMVLPEVGAGIAYSFTPNLRLGLSYYHVFGQDVTFNNNADAENLPSVNMGLLEFSYFF